jgi:hypothetical protein
VMFVDVLIHQRVEPSLGLSAFEDELFNRSFGLRPELFDRFFSPFHSFCKPGVGFRLVRLCWCEHIQDCRYSLEGLFVWRMSVRIHLTS